MSWHPGVPFGAKQSPSPGHVSQIDWPSRMFSDHEISTPVSAAALSLTVSVHSPAASSPLNALSGATGV